MAWRYFLSARPFDEVDALVIATFSYIHLDGIVPDSNKEISIKEVAKNILIHQIKT